MAIANKKRKRKKIEFISCYSEKNVIIARKTVRIVRYKLAMVRK